MSNLDPRTVTFLLLLVPLVATFLLMRLYLHLVNPDADLFIGRHNVHHLFSGAVLAVPAALVVAFVPQETPVRWFALVFLGTGSSMVLDQVVFLITTDGSNAAYLLPVSLWGAIVLEGLAVALLVALYLLT